MQSHDIYKHTCSNKRHAHVERNKLVMVLNVNFVFFFFFLDDYSIQYVSLAGDEKSFTCHTSELDADHGQEEAVQLFKRKRKPM